VLKANDTLTNERLNSILLRTLILYTNYNEAIVELEKVTLTRQKVLTVSQPQFNLF